MDKSGRPRGVRRNQKCAKKSYTSFWKTQKNDFLKNKNDCFLQRTNISPATDIIYIFDVEFVL